MGETEEKMFTVYEWTIENFTCWKSEVRNSKLVTEPRSDMVQLVLIRRKISPGNEKLWVNIGNVFGRAKGDFSLQFPGGDWMIKVDKDQDYDYDFIGLLPFTFGEIVALIKKREATEIDRLTLRIRYENEEGNVFHSIHSKFEDRTLCMKIPLSSILNSQPGIIKSRVITAEYPLNNDSTERVKVKINERQRPSKIELILEPCSSEESTHFRTSMSVLNNEGSIIRTEEREAEIPKGETWMFSDSLSRNEAVLEELSIHLRLTVFPGTNNFTHLYTLSTPFIDELEATNIALPNEPKHAVGVLLKDFSNLHRNQDFADLQLRCEGVSFPAHKSILSARSPVFRVMLCSDMKEAATGSVDIEDLDAPTLAHFLTFLYSGTVKDLRNDDEAIKLYYAADKYMVPTLKTACVDFLSEYLSAKNVCEVLGLAVKLQDNRLMSAAQSFISKNRSEVLISKEWDCLTKRDSVLAGKILLFLEKDVVNAVKDAEENYDLYP